MPPDADNEGTSGTAASTSRPRRERVAQACENCRAQKAKCRPSLVPGTCEKCLKTQKQCIPHIPKAAASVGKGKRRSLAKMESRIEALYELLNKAGPEAQRSLRDAEKDFGNFEDESDDDDSPLPAPQESRSNGSGGQSTQSPNVAPSASANDMAAEWEAKNAPRRANPPNFDTFAARDSLSQDEKLSGTLFTALDWPRLTKRENYFKLTMMLGPSCEQLLSMFHLILPYFPFVHLPPGITAMELARHHPMLLTAIMCATSNHNKVLQKACEDMFRNAVAIKAIVAGQKSLDIIQGLLIYIGWHHMFFDVETQALSGYVNLATSMAIDLNLDRRFTSNRRANLITEPDEIDGMRALLGCYYLNTTSTSLAMNKPPSMQWSQTLELCAAEVAAKGPSPWDCYMPAMTSLMHIANDIKSSLRTPVHAENIPGALTGDSDIRITLSYSHLESRLRAWDVDFPTKELTWLTPTRHFLSIYLFESALLPSNILNSSLSPSRHHDLLVACLSSARLFLDGALASPALIFDRLNLGTWAHVLAAIFAVARLSRPMPPELCQAVHWDYNIALSTVNLPHYIDAVVARMREQAAQRPYTQQTQLLDWFVRISSRILADLGTLPDDDEHEQLGDTVANISRYAQRRDNLLAGDMAPNSTTAASREDLLFWDSFMGVTGMAEFGLI